MFAPPVPSIAPEKVTEDMILIDVREPQEWQAGHAPTALHIPMMDIPTRMKEVPREGDVVVICRSGARSAQVVAYLMGNGWDNAYNLEGGMKVWAATGRQVIGDKGTPGAVV
ncbi:MAG: rhodanese-like domain-containing protein [Longispora sp.]|nr:rhodanese-like domain-containing protein [Longispora sp. (in: high G+C Gram-positive bacteria)]